MREDVFPLSGEKNGEEDTAAIPVCEHFGLTDQINSHASRPNL